MPPRKKLKRDKCTSKEEVKETSQNSSESTQLVAENNSSGENLYFSLLPNEVLLIIYKYLSPADLLSIAELGDSRLKQLIFLTKEYNFSSCRKANLDMKFFFNGRHITNNIRKLNFNNEMYLKPYEIVQFIYKCKNLTRLSIVNCGIKYHHIWDILLRCKKLQELAWDVSEDYFLKTCQDGLHPSVKSVYLFGDITKQKSFSSTIRKSVVYTQNIFLNFSGDSFLALPFLGTWCRAYCISYLNNVYHAYVYNSFQCCMEEFNSKKESYRIAEKDTLWHPSVYNSPPFLQIRTLESDISLLQSHASNTISSVNLILHPKIADVWMSLVQALTKVGEQSLKYLSIDSTGTSEYDDHAISGPISAEDSLAVCDVFDKVFMTFKNITVLNIATVHFSSCSPFITGYRLESLRNLSISSCAFKSFKLSGFDKVVSRCPKVRSFSLYCCQDDQNKLSEKDMIPMRAWKELRHLTLYSLIFKNCSFLKKVADSCKKFTSLSIITVHPNSVCLFMTDLIYVLKVAKNLSFIRINVKNFNPMYEGFWNAIGEAKNLEGICLITESNTYVTTQAVLKGIKKLKHLHLFHLYAQKTPENLNARVKKSFQDQGINNVKIERDCNISNRECKRPYYHQQPRFCCTRLHLNKMNIL